MLARLKHCKPQPVPQYHPINMRFGLRYQLLASSIENDSPNDRGAPDLRFAE